MKLPSSRFFLGAAALGGAALIASQEPSRAADIFERIVTTQTQAIRYEATEYQRKVAEANAHAYMAAQRKAQAAHTAKAKPPRYVAVDTVKDKRASAGTKKVMMIWDTQSETLVGNNVYDVQKPPSIGSTANFDTYSAQYVGNGL
jgi:hypothetical protein